MPRHEQGHNCNDRSLPTRGGWIEISKCSEIHAENLSPSPHGEGGLKCMSLIISLRWQGSLPTRGGWIEMGKYIKSDPLGLVPPLKLLY